MVTVVENSEDTKGITVCRVFQIDEAIKVDKLYQYILYRDGETIKILITPGFDLSPEVGTDKLQGMKTLNSIVGGFT